jgi:nitrate/nitrite-specific signal transduction histidine kinase
MSEEKSEEGLTLDKRTMDVLVANIIPTSKYFEVRFDHMQDQIDGLRGDLKDFRSDVDKRFDSVKSEMVNRFDAIKLDMNKRFDAIKSDMDRRFDAVKLDMDKRFEQVDKRFEQVIASIDRLGDKLEHRDEKQRAFTLRMFTIAISISILGVLGAFLKSLGVI